MKICLDAGHGLHTAGKRTPEFENGTVIHEAEQNYPIMFKVKAYLEYNGIEVLCTNSNIENDMPLNTRTARANTWKADMFISIHKDAITGYWQKNYFGIGSYVYSMNYESAKIAKEIQAQLVADTGMKNRGIKVANFQVLRDTKMPAVLLELGFMDNQNEANQMLNKEWHDKYAKSIVKGIGRYLNIEMKFPFKEEDKAMTDNTEAPKWKTDPINRLLEEHIITDEKWLRRTDDDDFSPFWAEAIMIGRLLDRIKNLEKIIGGNQQ